MGEAVRSGKHEREGQYGRQDSGGNLDPTASKTPFDRDSQAHYPVTRVSGHRRAAPPSGQSDPRSYRRGPIGLLAVQTPRL
jgi:hypothetical protein